MEEYGAYRAALGDRELPAAFLDRGAFEANLDRTATRAGDLPVRVATKSVRCVGVLERLLSEPGFEGLMCYTAMRRPTSRPLFSSSSRWSVTGPRRCGSGGPGGRTTRAAGSMSLRLTPSGSRCSGTPRPSSTATTAGPTVEHHTRTAADFDDFREIGQEMDPDGLFLNDHLRDVFDA